MQIRNIIKINAADNVRKAANQTEIKFPFKISIIFISIFSQFKVEYIEK